MSRLKQTLLGAARPLARALTGNSGRILMYHRFGERGAFRRMSVDIFEEQIRYLSERYQVVPLRSLVSQLRERRPLSRAMVAITVDDGYGDFVEYAYPVLQKYRVPATVYLVAGFVAREVWLWFDAIHYLASKAPSRRYTLDIGVFKGELALDSAESRNALWDKVADACLPLAPAARAEALRKLATQLDTHLPPEPTHDYSAMTWEQARDLDPELVEIGAHTYSHPILSYCARDEQHREIQSGRQRIEAELQRPVTSFCYPNGQMNDFNTDSVELLQKLEFSSAVVAHGGMIRSGADLFRLERLPASEDMDEFRRLVDGVTEVRRRIDARMRPQGSSATEDASRRTY